MSRLFQRPRGLRRSNSPFMANQGTGWLISGLAARWFPCSAFVAPVVGASFGAPCLANVLVFRPLADGWLLTTCSWVSCLDQSVLRDFMVYLGIFGCLVGPCCTRAQSSHALALAVWRGVLTHSQLPTVPKFVVFHQTQPCPPRARRSSGSFSALACF